MSGTDRLVVLRGGVSVPADAYLLTLSFEARGITLERSGDALMVGTSDHLTDADRQTIRACKPFLLTLADYCQRLDLDAHLFTDQPREVVHV